MLPRERTSRSSPSGHLVAAITQRAHLAAALSNPAATIAWSVPASSGSSDDSPCQPPPHAHPTGGGARHVTVTCSADDGMSTDEAALELIIMTLPNRGQALDLEPKGWKLPWERHTSLCLTGSQTAMLLHWEYHCTRSLIAMAMCASLHSLLSLSPRRLPSGLATSRRCCR